MTEVIPRHVARSTVLHNEQYCTSCYRAARQLYADANLRGRVAARCRRRSPGTQQGVLHSQQSVHRARGPQTAGACRDQPTRPRGSQMKEVIPRHAERRSSISDFVRWGLRFGDRRHSAVVSRVPAQAVLHEYHSTATQHYCTSVRQQYSITV